MPLPRPALIARMFGATVVPELDPVGGYQHGMVVRVTETTAHHSVYSLARDLHFSS